MQEVQEIMGILNKDQKARKLLNEFNQAAAKYGITEEEYRRARETIVLLAILNSKEAFNKLADTVWQQINKGGM